MCSSDLVQMNILPLSLVVLELIYAIFTTSPSALLRIGAMSIKNQAVFCQQIGAIQLTSSFVARNYLVQFRIRWEQIPKSRVWEELCHYCKVSLD